MDAELAQYRLYLQRQKLAGKTIYQLTIRLKILLQACTPFSSETFSAFLSSHASQYSAASLNKYVQAAVHYVRWRKLDVDQSLLRRYRETPKTRVTLTNEELMALLTIDPANKKMTAFWHLCAFTGAREGEVAVLRQHHVDLAGKKVIIEKSKHGTGREIAISEMLFPVLEDYLRSLETDLLFPRAQDPERPISEKNWEDDFDRRKKLLGITKKATPYSTRHSTLTRLGLEGVDLRTLMDIAGHTDPRSTMVYLRSNLKAQANAFRKDPLLKKKIGGKGIVKIILDFIDKQELDECSDIDFIKVLEAKRLLWEAVRDQEFSR